MTRKKIMVISPELKVSDVSYNTEQIIKAYTKASEEGMDLLVLPELCITSVSCGDLFLNAKLLECALDSLFLIASSTEGKKTMIIVSLPVHVSGKVYEAATILGDGEVLSLIPRTSFSDKQCDKLRWFSKWDPSSDVVILDNGKEVYCCSDIDINNTTYGICFDEDESHCGVYDKDIVVLYTSSTEYIGRNKKIRDTVTCTSKTYKNVIVSVTPDRTESTGKGVCSGYSVISYKGKLYSESRLFDDKPISTDLKEMITNHNDDIDDCELAVLIQAHSLAQRLKKIWVSKVVLGISGGLDSTQALLAGVKAMDILGYSRKNVKIGRASCRERV